MVKTWFGFKTLKNIFESQKFRWDLNAMSSLIFTASNTETQHCSWCHLLGPGTLLAHTSQVPLQSHSS